LEDNNGETKFSPESMRGVQWHLKVCDTDVYYFSIGVQKTYVSLALAIAWRHRGLVHYSFFFWMSVLQY